MAKGPEGRIFGAALVAVMIAWLPAGFVMFGLTFVFDLSDDRDFNIAAFFVFYLTAAFFGSLAYHMSSDK